MKRLCATHEAQKIILFLCDFPTQPSFRDGPKDQAPDAQVRIGESRDSPMCNCTSEVRCFACRRRDGKRYSASQPITQTPKYPCAISSRRSFLSSVFEPERGLVDFLKFEGIEVTSGGIGKSDRDIFGFRKSVIDHGLEQFDGLIRT